MYLYLFQQLFRDLIRRSKEVKLVLQIGHIFISTFILEALFYQIDSVFRQKKSTTCNNNNNDMHSIYFRVTYQKRI